MRKQEITILPVNAFFLTGSTINVGVFTVALQGHRVPMITLNLKPGARSHG
jgi:hypothetical protein